nr:DUF1835 domain-containing protein [uncultured Roseococcus sp.]
MAPPGSPFRLNLEQQRKRAKELLRGLRDGEAEALARFGRQHPRAREPLSALALSDAQLVIARELGLPSWPRLKAHIDRMEASRERIARGGAAPDRDMTTLHLRCGHDIRPWLQEAGFRGDFLEYSDPLCQGPVVNAPDWLDRRAGFIAQAYGAGVGLDREAVAAKLRGSEEGLASAASRYGRVVLWFEHDIYDQLILARCLAHFAETPPERLELVSTGHYPGGTRFIGLGQLPPEALRLLWEERRPVPEAALRAGRLAWDALRAPDPRPLAALAQSGTEGLPSLGRAIRRHCQELPWTSDGLGLTAGLTLRLIAEEAGNAGQVFGRLMMEREPLPWMTDLIFRELLRELESPSEPVFTGLGDEDWPRARLSITPLGRRVLAGEVDWLSLRPRPRWVGGVEIPGDPPCWRWDEGSGSALRR